MGKTFGLSSKSLRQFLLLFTSFHKELTPPGNQEADALVPVWAIEDIIAKIEAFIKFTQQALKDSNKACPYWTLEMSSMKKAVFQKTMALDIITASQVGPCAIIQIKRCTWWVC